MARVGSCPAVFEDQISLSLATLKRLDYLIGYCNQPLSWHLRGKTVATIELTVNIWNTRWAGNFMLLEYPFKSESRNERIELVTAPSNLGKGQVWYFVCPLTGRRCRKLYRDETTGRFASRYAQPNAYYGKQLWPRRFRQLDATLGRCYRLDELGSKLFARYAKRHYQGKPTKRMLHYNRLEGQSE